MDRFLLNQATYALLALSLSACQLSSYASPRKIAILSKYEICIILRGP